MEGIHSTKFLSIRLESGSNWNEFKREFENACLSEGLLEYLVDGINVPEPQEAELVTIEAMRAGEEKGYRRRDFERKKMPMTTFKAERGKCLPTYTSIVHLTSEKRWTQTTPT
jgi:hypothetical protein